MQTPPEPHAGFRRYFPGESSLGRLLLGKTLDAQSCHDDTEDEQSHGEGQLEQVPGGGGAHQGHHLLHQSGQGDCQHDTHGNTQHPALALGLLQEHGTGNERQGAEQLVGGAEQRPDGLKTVVCRWGRLTMCYNTWAINEDPLELNYRNTKK